MDCKEGGGWFPATPLHPCLAAARLALSPEGAARNCSRNTHRGWPCTNNTNKGKASCLMFCPLLCELLEEREKCFCFYCNRLEKRTRCAGDYSSGRLVEESLCVSSCTCLVVRKMALPPVPCIWTEPRHACICPDKLGETVPTQVKEAVSKPHV